MGGLARMARSWRTESEEGWGIQEKKLLHIEEGGLENVRALSLF
ncbi:hypothetical protein [Mesobacillus foraminis]|nr:hypothetical protein [Mesobacillus foraminis]